MNARYSKYEYAQKVLQNHEKSGVRKQKTNIFDNLKDWRFHTFFYSPI